MAKVAYRAWEQPLSERITVRNIQEMFLRMEEAEDLFDMETADGTHYWDVVRINVFTTLYNVYGGGVAEPSSPPQPGLVSKGKDFVRSLINQWTRRYLAAQAPRYVFVTGQRIRRGSQLFDPIADHLYDLLSENAIAVELMNKAVVSYAAMLVGRRTRIPAVNVRAAIGPKDLPRVVERITLAVGKHFGASIHVRGPVLDALATFKENKDYYRQLFAKHRPKAIVCIDNGTLKGLFSAAKEARVPTVELQHGEINSRSMHYSYPKSVPSSHAGLALPTALLTFADYWNEITHFPVRSVHAIGNDFFYQERVAGDDNGILMISAYFYHAALMDLALEVADLVGPRTIYYKLHPNQFDQKDAIVAACSSRRNVVVVSDEMELAQLLKRCNYVVGVSSTMIYIALQAGKKVCLYKRSNYFCHDDVFAYVELFDSASELRDIIDSPPGKHFGALDTLPIFFEPFTPRRFTQALERVASDGA